MVQGNSTRRLLKAAEIHHCMFSFPLSQLCYSWRKCSILNLLSSTRDEGECGLALLRLAAARLESSLLTLLSGELGTPFRMLQLWDEVDSLANLIAVIDQRGKTCAKKVQPEAENSKNESWKQET